jgi:hypothetical protein
LLGGGGDTGFGASARSVAVAAGAVRSIGDVGSVMFMIPPITVEARSVWSGSVVI